jgi:hypothetical protein
MTMTIRGGGGGEKSGEEWMNGVAESGMGWVVKEFSSPWFSELTVTARRDEIWRCSRASPNGTELSTFQRNEVSMKNPRRTSCPLKAGRIGGGYTEEGEEDEEEDDGRESRWKAGGAGEKNIDEAEQTKHGDWLDGDGPG